ncbi:phosphopantetheine-binding protein [Blautia sp. RD014234]|nr:phosphopantetheine-binding protein [Blautia parvula]
MEEKILDLLAEICEDDIVKEDLKTELFQSGLLDSLGFAEFLAGLEEECGIVIAPQRSPGKKWIPRKNPQSCKIQMLTRERQA